MDQVEVNLFGDQDSSGDIWVFDSNEVTTDGYESGTSAGRCILLEDVDLRNNMYCSMALEFPEGAIVFSGKFSDGLAVVAGTGCFAGLTATVDLGSNDAQDAFAYEVTPATAPDTCDLSIYDNPWNMEGGYTFVDWDENGPSAGDSYVFERREVIASGGAQGFADGECLVLQDTRDDKAFCSVTFDFGDDKIYLMGVLDDMVVISGQGCFLDATGKVGGQIGSGANTFKLDLDDPDSIEEASCSEDLFDNIWTEVFGETTVDYSDPCTTSGDAYVFDNKPLTIPTNNGNELGNTNGRCIFLQDFADTFCNLVLRVGQQGSVVLSGFYSNMIVVGGS